ncbi:hypothetical protein X975_16347, partial [Stegodyphus mimosarum]
MLVIMTTKIATGHMLSVSNILSFRQSLDSVCTFLSKKGESLRRISIFTHTESNE